LQSSITLNLFQSVIQNYIVFKYYPPKIGTQLTISGTQLKYCYFLRKDYKGYYGSGTFKIPYYGVEISASCDSINWIGLNVNLPKGQYSNTVK